MVVGIWGFARVVARGRGRTMRRLYQCIRGFYGRGSLDTFVDIATDRSRPSNLRRVANSVVANGNRCIINTVSKAIGTSDHICVLLSVTLVRTCAEGASVGAVPFNRGLGVG